VSTAICLHDEEVLSSFPLVRSWDHPEQPLPVRAIWAPRGSGRPHHMHTTAQPWLASGAAEKPFDFCKLIRRLTADVVARSEHLHHVDVDRVLFATTQARSSRPFGLQARVTPLRFRDGMLVRKRRGKAYQVQRYFVGDREMLYVMTFCLPRFLDQDFDDKLITLFHELYHISPAFDGDLRRHGGRYAIHSHSKRDYDEHMAHLARAYLANGAAPALHGFLRLNFSQLAHRHGQIVGIVVPRPKLIPLPARKITSHRR